MATWSVLWLVMQYVIGKTQDISQEGRAVFLANNHEAQYLDGSPGLFYFSPGTDRNKYVLFFQGGGVCVGVTHPPEPSCFDSCYQRSLGRMGSSTLDRPIINMNAVGGPILNNDPTLNPLMANWNHIFVRYCDGGFYAGYKQNPDVVNNHRIYYRGSVILQEIIETLQTRFGMSAATDIVIAGCSAGAQAIYMNINRMYSLIGAHGAKIYTVADSGFIMDSNGIDNSTQMSNGQKIAYEQHGFDVSVPVQCIADAKRTEGMEEYQCALPQYNSKYIVDDVHFFALQSQFDSFQIPCVLGTKQTDLVQQFGDELVSTLEDALLNDQLNHGAFIDSCGMLCSMFILIILVSPCVDV